MCNRDEAKDIARDHVAALQRSRLQSGVVIVTDDTNYVQLAVEHGQLTVEEHVLDDEPDSPTEGQYFVLYRETEPVND